MPRQTLIPGASDLHFNHSPGPVTVVGGLAILACALPRAITAEE